MVWSVGQRKPGLFPSMLITGCSNVHVASLKEMGIAQVLLWTGEGWTDLVTLIPTLSFLICWLLLVQLLLPQWHSTLKVSLFRWQHELWLHIGYVAWNGKLLPPLVPLVCWGSPFLDQTCCFRWAFYCWFLLLSLRTYLCWEHESWKCWTWLNNISDKLNLQSSCLVALSPSRSWKPSALVVGICVLVLQL